MKRLMPYQNVNPYDVVNQFAMNVANDMITDSGDGDNGVIVSVLSGNQGSFPIEYKVDSFLGTTTSNYMGFNQFPHVKLKTKACESTENPIGVTLLQTANKDENGESFLRYPQKERDIYCVHSGQAVPIATKGMFTFTYKAFGTGSDKSYVPAPGSRLILSASAGRMTGISEANYRASVTGTSPSHIPAIGKVISTGTNVSLNGLSDEYSGGTGAYYYATCLIDIA